MSPFYPVVEPFYTASQRALKPLRLAGVYGSPDYPLHFEAGETVPWWILCRFPMATTVQFECAAETYYEDGYQWVRPLFRETGAIVRVGCRGGRIPLLVGAPTAFSYEPRERITVNEPALTCV